MDQLRADALIDRLVGAPGSGAGGAAGRSPIINVTVGLATLTGRDDEPGWLDDYGPIPAPYARQLAHDPTGTWRRLVTDPVDGQLLDYGKTRYTPPRHLGDHMVARDGTCAFPFCDHRARNATSTTSSPTRTDPPAPRTCSHYIDATTTPRPTAAGGLNATRTAERPGGSAHKDAPTGADRLNGGRCRTSRRPSG